MELIYHKVSLFMESKTNFFVVVRTIKAMSVNQCICEYRETKLFDMCVSF